MVSKRKGVIAIGVLCVIATVLLGYYLYTTHKPRGDQTRVQVPSWDQAEQVERVPEFTMSVKLAKPEIQSDPAPPSPTELEQPPAHLTVFVYDGAGSPASGANVTLQYVESQNAAVTSGMSLNATTDSVGFTEFNDLPWGWAWLFAEHGNKRSQQVRLAFRERGFSREMVLILQNVGMIVGKVLTSRGAPIAEARVVVCERDLSSVLGAEDDLTAQFTDPVGRFVFSHLTEGLYRFRAYAKGYAPGESEAILTDGGREAAVYMAQGSTVSGTVYSEVSGNTIGGFPILIWQNDSGGRRWTLNSDEEGHFELAGLAEGTYSLKSTDATAAFTEGTVDVEVPPASDVSGLELLARDGIRVAGRVLAEGTDGPVADVRVVASDAGGAGTPRESQPTDQDGNYLLEGVIPGANYFTVQSQGVYRSARLMMVVPPLDSVEEFDIHIPASGTVEGVVLDSSGVPVAGARIESMAWKEGVAQHRSGRTLTNQNGSFTLGGMSCPPDYALVLKASSARGESEPTGPFTTREEGLRGIVLRLNDKPLGYISGRVVNMIGAPVLAWVLASPMDKKVGDFRGGYSARSDVNGQFIITALREDEYDLLVSEYNPQGFQSADQEAGHVFLRAGQHVSGLELVLDAGTGDIPGTVTDENGRPIPDVYVGAQIDVDAKEFECRSDESGQFRLPNLQEGLYIVKAVKEGYESQRILA